MNNPLDGIEKMQQVIANAGPIEVPNPADVVRAAAGQPIPDTPAQPTETPAAAEEQPAVETVEVPKFSLNELFGEDFALGEGETIDTIKEKAKTWRGYDSLKAEYEKSKSELDGAYRLMSQFKDPFEGMDDVRQVYLAKKTLGISDPAVMIGIANATPESLVANPVDTLAYAIVSKQPGLMNNGALSLSFQEIRDMARTQLEDAGWKEGEPLDTKQKFMVGQAMQEVLAKTATVKDAKVDFVEEYRNKINTLTTGAEQRLTSAKKEIAPRAASLLKERSTIKNGETAYSLFDDKAVGESIDEALTQLVGAGIQEITPEMVAAQAAASIAYKRPLSEIVNSITGQLTTDITKKLEGKYHNGQPVARPSNPDAKPQGDPLKFIEGLPQQFKK